MQSQADGRGARPAAVLALKQPALPLPLDTFAGRLPASAQSNERSKRVAAHESSSGRWQRRGSQQRGGREGRPS